MGKKRPISATIVLPEDEPHSPSGTTDFSKIRHNGEVLEGYAEVNTNKQTEFQATVRFEGLTTQKIPRSTPVPPIDAHSIGTSRTWIRPDNTGSDNAPISTGEHKVSKPPAFDLFRPG
jgi:hypothetical protein